MKSIAEHGHTSEIRQGRKHVHGIRTLRLWKKFCIMYVWSCVMLCSVLQITVSPTWVWRSIKLITLSFVCLLFIFGGWYLGLHIYTYTYNRESDLENSGSQRKTPLPFTDNAKSQQLAKQHMKREKQRAQRRKEIANQRRIQIISILKFLIVSTTVSGVVLGTQLYNAAMAAKTKYDIKDNPEPLPDTPWLAFWSQDGLQFVACLMTLFFFRPKEKDDMGSGDSKTKQPEPDRKSPRSHQGHKKAKEKRAPRSEPIPPTNPATPTEIPHASGGEEADVLGPSGAMGRITSTDHHAIEMEDIKVPMPVMENHSNGTGLKLELPPILKNPLPSDTSNRTPRSPKKAEDFARYMVDHLETGVLVDEKLKKQQTQNKNSKPHSPHGDHFDENSPRLKIRLINNFTETPTQDSPEIIEEKHLERRAGSGTSGERGGGGVGGPEHSGLGPLPTIHNTKIGLGKLHFNNELEKDLAYELEHHATRDSSGGGKFRNSNDTQNRERGATTGFRSTATGSVIPESIRKQSNPTPPIVAAQGILYPPSVPNSVFHSSPSHSISQTRSVN